MSLIFKKYLFKVNGKDSRAMLVNLLLILKRFYLFVNASIFCGRLATLVADFFQKLLHEKKLNFELIF